MSDDVIQPSQALIVRPTVLPSTAQFGIMRDLAIRLASAKGFLPAHYFLDDRGNPATGEEKMAKVLAAIEYGRAVGIEPMIALQNITMIKGKAGASAMLIGAQLRRGGYKIKTSWFDQQGAAVPKESPNVWGCKVTLTQRGEETGDGVFSLTDAQRAGLVKEDSGWARYPKDMLYARALTQAAREGAQDAILGMQYTAEELGADVDEEGRTETLPASNGPVIDMAPGVPEATAGTQLPTAAAIQPAPPAPSVEVPPTAIAAGAGEQASGAGVSGEGAPSTAATQPQPDPATTPPPPQTASVNVAPLSGPALSRRMGAGRSIGPAPKRTNVVTAEPPATAPEAPPQAVASAEAVPSQPAPPGLTDEPVPAAPVDDGLGPQRELLRQSAADLARVNAILRNKMEHALKNEPLEPVPPKEPTAVSDEGLARLIDRDYPGRTLANLDGEAIQNRLELVESNLAKKKTLMLERGITEE